MNRLFIVALLALTLSAWAHAQSPPLPNYKPAQTQAVEKTHWLNTSSGVRHNKACRWFGVTKTGRYCAPGEGRPCKLCGG